MGSFFFQHHWQSSAGEAPKTLSQLNGVEHEIMKWNRAQYHTAVLTSMPKFIPATPRGCLGPHCKSNYAFAQYAFAQIFFARYAQTHSYNHYNHCSENHRCSKDKHLHRAQSIDTSHTRGQLLLGECLQIFLIALPARNHLESKQAVHWISCFNRENAFLGILPVNVKKKHDLLQRSRTAWLLYEEIRERTATARITHSAQNFPSGLPG